jgi:hypothetical protein
MDCEGAELSILASLDSATLNDFDAFVLEYHPEAYDLQQFMGMLLSWEGHHISKVVSSDRDLANANLSIVKADIIRQWCGSPPVKHHPQTLSTPTAPKQQAVA